LSSSLSSTSPSGTPYEDYLNRESVLSKYSHLIQGPGRVSGQERRGIWDSPLRELTKDMKSLPQFPPGFFPWDFPLRELTKDVKSLPQFPLGFLPPLLSISIPKGASARHFSSGGERNLPP